MGGVRSAVVAAVVVGFVAVAVVIVVVVVLTREQTATQAHGRNAQLSTHAAAA
jgi:ascorbate-specific PTS system EIIC-type component UlaA